MNIHKADSVGFGTVAKTFLLLVALVVLVGCQGGTPQPSGDPAELARVTVQGTGLYKITARSLADVGWTTDTPLTLRFNDVELPYQRRGEDILFYLPLDTPARYGQTHTLWLTPAAPTLAPLTVAESAAVTTMSGIVRLGADEQYSTQHPGAPWFWRTIAGPASESFTVATPGRQEGEMQITLNMAGVTQVPHQIEMVVGEQSLGTLSWDGIPRYSETLTISLPAGESLDFVLNVPEGASGVDISVIDDIVVEYPSSLTANSGDGIFYGKSAGAGAATFSGVGDTPVAWQVLPEVALLAVGEDGAVVGVPADSTFVVANPSVATDAAVSRASDPTIATTGAEYIAIVDPLLQSTIEPLLEYHRSTGLSVASYTPQQVYDAYSYGAIDPLAFRDLLKEGLESWEVKPRFILLVGDSTYDPGGFLNALPPTYVPSPFVNSVYGGETVSDNVIADVDEDGYPDVALGRLPARTVEQLKTIVDKNIAYSQTPADGAWRSRVLFAADGREDLFQETSERLRTTYLPEGVEGVSVYPEAASDALSQMMPSLSEGSFIVNYVGHGSVQQWGRDQLLTTQAVPTMSNGNRLPIYINMTCLTGLFSHPNQESLAESLLWNANGGAIATIAPTSLTLPTSQSRLNATLLQQLLSPERPTIGEALNIAKRDVQLNGANEHDIVATFNLLGDPALRPAPIPAQGESAQAVP